MKVILEIDHTVTKEEIIDWIEEILKPSTPCVWGYSFEEHHCGSCHNSQLEKENAELKEQIESLANINIKAQNIIADLKAEIENYKMSENESLEIISELNRDKTELTNSVTELKTKVTELEAQLKNNPYVELLQNEKAELAEDFAKQIEKMKWGNKEILKDNEYYQNENEQLKQQIEEITSMLWWESHTDDDKLRNIWKVLLPDERYVRD